VIRFPVELRAKPSIDLLIEVAPDSREVELIAEAFDFDAPDPDGRSKADRAMAETIARTDLPADPKERRAALNAMLKPLVDRAVAACVEARQAALRSDAAGEKLASAQIEGGYWLKPLEDAADHWAVESARLLLAAYEAAQAAHGAGRAIEFAKRGESWGPSNIDEDVDHSSPPSGRSPARAALLPFGERAALRAAPRNEGYLFAPSSPTLNVWTFRETGHGNGMPVACLVAARERRPDEDAEEKGIGAVALAAPYAGRARPCDRGRRELGRSGDRIAERPAGSGQPDLSGAGPAGVQLSTGRPVGHRQGIVRLNSILPAGASG